MSVDIEVTFHDEVGEEILLDVINAVREGVEVIEQVATDIAPRDTGELADSIHVEEDEGEAFHDFFIIADPRQDRAPNGYALFVELGTARNRKQPFMIPGFEVGTTVIIAKLEGI